MTRSVLGRNPQRAGNEIQVLSTIDAGKNIQLNNDIKVYWRNSSGVTESFVSTNTDDDMVLANLGHGEAIYLICYTSTGGQRTVRFFEYPGTERGTLFADSDLSVHAFGDLILMGDVVNVDAPLRVKSLTTTERNALTPVTGMIIYNTTTGNFEGYKASSWATLG